MIELTLLTRPDCHLCHEMETLLARELAGKEFRLATIDIEGDAELERQFGTEVPVLFINNRKAFKYRCTARELRRKLSRVARAR